jgi:parallel beta-helix repeat protein
VGITTGWSIGNEITENNISNNNYQGILFYVSSNENIVTRNTIMLNNAYGIRIWSSQNNEIYNNNFIENKYYQVLFQGDCTGNVFNMPEPVGGNYWDEWTSPDTDGDGFVDTPYNVGYSVYDYLPWTKQDGWANQAPVADAGPDQSAHPGIQVTLDGSGSSDPDENYPLAYSWQILYAPEGSMVMLADSNTVSPSFTPDLLGDYLIELIVTDSAGAESAPDEVLVSTFNAAPVADAGQDQAVIELGTIVHLDGTQSYDEEGDDITYYWEIILKPLGSLAELDDNSSPTPTFTADVHGDYEVSLTVTDIFEAPSEADTVIVSFENVRPVADPGPNRSVIVDDVVLLNGLGSSDANLDQLTYSWSFASKPEGSLAVLSEPQSAEPSFTADLPGEYIVSLVVSDGFEDSEPSNATIMAITTQDAAAMTLIETVDTINTIPTEYLNNKNLANTLTNKINAVLAMIEEGQYAEALEKLEYDLLYKTNGCADIGEPDKNDWIRDCDEQAGVYELILETMELLERLI